MHLTGPKREGSERLDDSKRWHDQCQHISIVQSYKVIVVIHKEKLVLLFHTWVYVFF